MSNVSDESYTEHRKTHFFFSKVFFSENLAMCEKMWKNIVGPGWPQMTL